jgi:apolipoprotein N-acyltransferase
LARQRKGTFVNEVLPDAGARPDTAKHARSWIPRRPGTGLLLRLGAAVGIGLLLRFVVGLEPTWWLAWLAPVPLLVLALNCGGHAARWLTALAALIGVSANFPHYRLVVPLPAAALLTLAQALLCVWVVSATRRVVLRHQSWWTVFAYPILWSALDMLMAAFLPEGNWGSLAYSQSEFLPALQLTSLFGVPGLQFLLGLVPSALALALVYGGRLHGARWAYVTPALLLAAALGYGSIRLRQPAAGPLVSIGLVAVDDAIGPGATPFYVAQIWGSYDQQVKTLAAQGARIVLLPEKIALLDPVQASAVRRHLGELAASHHLWIDAGFGLDDGTRKLNVSWRFAPDGTLSQVYQKHHMAPPEREFASGTDYALGTIDGASYGTAICKDMHFAALGRAYGRRQAAVMLVPAWDYDLDKWMAARMTLVRGVESGFTVVRAARDGLLTVSDPYGRVIAEHASSAMPGSALLVKVAVGAPLATLYKQIGDLFGWSCVAAAAILLASALRGQPQA